ncbi:ShlB/FhaC/HecB family hemolysin secretion/activation protein [Marinobacter zhanjiangensis]|uniref:Haemolysin activator HlyB C-terminal domain-containing protein n=1 Tax=Marinobacter zhanjiangensis TaxID=578215 RepID=A0ABQ3AX68_9GAMM|nr:ShlB/FhaC/HecB family hemolysin secretion/activation protein [Marinobacter zhanjiangensis]GGY70202.1 hypothetical protein GCM10007071_16450 [Marinobacter zhanjiangensis]
MPVAATGTPGQEPQQHQRTLNLLHESLLWIRHRHHEPVAASPSATVPVPVLANGSSAPIPISSVAARDRWIGQNFFVQGEDHEAKHADRVRVGFETDRIPGFSQNLSVNYNWSTSQQPGDTTMDMGIAWQVPLGDNQLSFRGRLHQYQDEVDSADVKQVGGTRQTLEIDMARSLYQGSHGGLDARVITTDVTRHWYENGDLSAEARRSYSLIRLDGYLERHLPAIDTYGDLGLTIEGCVALMDGADQQSCGEQLGAFQRYNLNASLRRQWLNMDWGLHGEYQFTPDELPSWRYMEVGPGMIHGFGGQVMRGREGGWLRLDGETRNRLLWSPLEVYTNLRFSLLRGWTDAAGDPHLTSRASVAEVRWQVSGDNLSGGVRAGTLLGSTGPGIVATHVPDVSVNLSWTL